jgi:DNA-binding transcriptional ArsR family regulator
LREEKVLKILGAVSAPDRLKIIMILKGKGLSFSEIIKRKKGACTLIN